MPSTPTMTIKAGDQAPDFSLSDEKGVFHELSAYRGKTVVLYFYPKDNTPGCTIEAQEFNEELKRFRKQGVVVLGVSPDSAKSHQKFVEKFDLAFPLLVDEGHQVAERYGAWGRKKFMGREYDGVIRSTFVIDPDGMIRSAEYKVSPKGHAKAVCESLSHS